MTSLRPLRPHQQLALDGVKASLMAGHRRPIVQAPTGAGKTVIAAHMVAGARAKSKRVAFVVPTLGLIDQTIERFVENGIDPSEIGVVQGDHSWRRPHAPIQVCTAQTLSRRDFPAVDVVVVDEAHVRFAVVERWMRDSSIPFVGLSATPWAKGLGKVYDDLVKPTSLAELIALGYLSPFRVFAPSKPDLTGVRTVAGDWQQDDLAEAVNKPQLVADIVLTWLLRGEDRPTLCFATGRQHAKAIHDQFESVGVPVAYVDADTPREERSEIGRRLQAGEIKIVCNIGTLTTGIDWDVRCLILARPTKSESLFVQIIGRALRTADGKADAIILDHSDTHMRLGMVTDIDHDELDTGREAKAIAKKREKKTPLPKCCPKCTALLPLMQRVCFSCGYEMPIRAPEMADGELVEMGAGGKAKPSSAIMELRKLGKQSVYSQLNAIRRETHRKPGWVAHTYRDIFGVWPRGLDDYKPEPASPLVLSYVRHKQIRFAKARPQEAIHAAG